MSLPELPGLPEYPLEMWRRPLYGQPQHVPQPPKEGRPNEDLSRMHKLEAQLRGTFRRPGGGSGGGPSFVVRNGVYVPLQYVDPLDPLQGGYGYGDPCDNQMTYHPGADLNSGGQCDSDLGMEVVASVGGVVLAVCPWDGYSSGEGNHLWVYYDAPECIEPAWGHFDHLRDFAVSEGQRFGAGQRLGHAGKTGNWQCTHLHLELLRQAPSSWYQWPYGWSLGAVQGAYFSPRWWFEETVLKAGGQQGGDDVRTTTTPEEREAIRPYFEQLGIAVNMDTALMQKACLAYYRDESRGPAMSDEYPQGEQGYVRQAFTAGTAEYHPDGTTYWVEVNRPEG
jgi:hypothetical protein